MLKKRFLFQHLLSWLLLASFLWVSPIQAQSTQTLSEAQARFEWIPEGFDSKKLAAWYIYSLANLRGGSFHELSLSEALATLASIPTSSRDAAHLGFHRVADIHPFRIVGKDHQGSPVEIHFVIASGIAGLFREYFSEEHLPKSEKERLHGLKKTDLVLIPVSQGKALGYIELQTQKGAAAEDKKVLS